MEKKYDTDSFPFAGVETQKIGIVQYDDIVQLYVIQAINFYV